jgi:hypothetical protein
MIAEYLDRSSLVARMKYYEEHTTEESGEHYAYSVALREIRNAPAADVAEVVRCRDCEHAERYERADGDAGYYRGHPQNSFTYGERWDRVFKPAKEADDSCSYGERKEGDNDNVSD